MHKNLLNLINRITIFFTFIIFTFNSFTIQTLAAKDYKAESEERKNMPIETNEYLNWPTGPKIGAESAILLDINSGAILYSKNIHEKLYPASITKILTALIAYDECNMDEIVIFSSEAIHSINWREDANMGINVGDSITMEQCLYGLLVGSANEAAYAIAEHICGPGNLDEFADLMNKKAKELGCVDSNFITPNGIHDENHYTSAYDMALIAQSFFSNELLSKISNTSSYHIPKTETQPKENMIVWAKSKLLEGKEYAYEPLVGTKTGYTDHARQTLVSCAEKNNMKLVCVILKEEAPYQFKDTIQLFEYGFENFLTHYVVEEDSTYFIDTSNFYSTNEDFFGNSKAIVEIDEDDYIILPLNVDFEDANSELIYDNLDEDIIARIQYSLNDIPIGYADIIPVRENPAVFDFSEHQQNNYQSESDSMKVIYINIKVIILSISIFSILLILIFYLKNKYIHSKKYNSKRHFFRKYKNKSRRLNWKDYNSF